MTAPTPERQVGEWPGEWLMIPEDCVAYAENYAHDNGPLWRSEAVAQRAAVARLSAEVTKGERDLDEVMAERDALEEVVAAIYDAAGGDREDAWVAKLPPEEPPHSGNAGADALALVQTLRDDVARLRSEVSYAANEFAKMRLAFSLSDSRHQSCRDMAARLQATLTAPAPETPELPEPSLPRRRRTAPRSASGRLVWVKEPSSSRGPQWVSGDYRVWVQARPRDDDKLYAAQYRDEQPWLCNQGPLREAKEACQEHADRLAKGRVENPA